MIVTAANLSLAFLFNEAVTPKVLVVRDQTDWLAFGIDVSLDPLTPPVQIWLKCTVVTAPAPVVFYDNNTVLPPADIVTGNSATNVIPIPVPLDIDGTVLKGHYIFEGTCKIQDGINAPYSFPFIYEFDYEYDSPCVKITVRVNCLDSNITSIDATDYGPYATTIVRVHTIFPPPASGLPSLTSALTTLIYNNIVTTTWSTKIESTVTFTFPNGLQATRLISGIKEYRVKCSLDIQAFLKCLAEIIKGNEWNRFNNPSKFKEEEAKVNRLRSMLLLWMVYERMGCATEADCLADDLKKLSGCQGCGCDDNTPKAIVPIGPSNALTYVVDSPLGTIQVTPDLQGNTMFYHIEKFTSNIPTVKVDTQTPAYITIVAGSSGGTTTYYVNFTGIIPNPDHCAIWLRIKKVGTVWTLFVIPMWVNGNGMNPFADHIYYLGGSWPVPAVDADFAIVRYENFVNATVDPPPLFTVHSQVNNNFVAQSTATIKSFYGMVKQVEAEVFYTDLATGNAFELRLYDPVSAMPLKLADLKDRYDVILSLLINVQT